jgi:hypothetical protein
MNKSENLLQKVGEGGGWGGTKPANKHMLLSIILEMCIPQDSHPCRGVTTGGFGGGGCLTPPIFRNVTLVGQKLRKGRAKPGTKLKGGVGGVTNHLDWQGNERF